MYNIENIELLCTKLTEKRLHHPFHIPNIIRPISITLQSKFIPKSINPQIFWRKIHKICGTRISSILNEKDSFLVQNTSKNIKLLIFICKNSSRQELHPIISSLKTKKMTFLTHFTHCRYTLNFTPSVKSTT